MLYYFALFLLFVSLILIFWNLYSFIEKKYEHIYMISRIFDIDERSIIAKEHNKRREKFELKLVQSGLSRKDFFEIVGVSIVAGAAIISLDFMLSLSSVVSVAVIIIGLFVAVFMPFLYLDEQIIARIKRIESDLAVFIDLLIIILEGGGGLNNAIDKVTTEGAGVLGKDLLEESKRFKNELIAYGSEYAYNNLVLRTGSEAIATIVGFMRLSEETGIGVKTIFENQASEIKESEMLNVEKKASTMNISITFVMFIFILPAVIAMIAFPMANDALMPAF